MTFQTYLQDLDNAVRGGGNLRDDIMASAAADKPTKTELLSFLTKLGAAVGVETKAFGGQKNAVQVDNRQKALAEIYNFVDSGSESGAFGGVDKVTFAFQLALRVRSPRIINQQNTTLCGPVAIAYDILKRDPVHYVKFAISLFSHGNGTLNGNMVSPSWIIRNSFHSSLLPEADYVVLVSMRDTDAIAVPIDLVRNILTLTKPGAVCEFLTRAGYTDVKDHTFFNMSTGLQALNAVTPYSLHGAKHNPYDKAEQNLLKAESDLNIKQRFIIMNADVAVSNAIYHRQVRNLGVRADALPADQTHWTAVRKLNVGAQNVMLKIVTWGGSFYTQVPKDVLLSRYAGYVSARM